jgi:hypothetical protein
LLKTSSSLHLLQHTAEKNGLAPPKKAARRETQRLFVANPEKAISSAGRCKTAAMDSRLI